VTGDTRSNLVNSKSDAFLMQTDLNGVPIWVNTYSRREIEDHGRCVIKTTDKNYFVVGFSNRCDSVYQDTCINCNDVFLFKTDLNGNLIWAEYVDIDAGNDFAFKVIETNNKYYVTGSTRTTVCTNTNIFLIQVDPTGTVDWVKTYGDTLDDFSYSLVAAIDTGIVMVGHTYNYSALNVPDVHVIKTDLNGIPQWKTTYNTQPNNRRNFGRDIKATKQEYYITGYSDIINSAFYDMHLIKITPLGQMLWQRAYGDTLDEKSFSLITLNNGVAMLGYTWSYGVGLDDVYLVRTDVNGVSCEIPLDTNFHYIDTLFKNPQYHVDSEYVYQAVHVRYDPRYDVDSLCYDTSHSHRLALPYSLSNDYLTLYPNPASGNRTVTVHFESGTEQDLTIEVYDQFGKRWLYIGDRSVKSRYEKEIDISTLPGGIYFVRVNTLSIKMLVVTK